MKRTCSTLFTVVLGLTLATTGCNLLTGSDESADDEILPEAPAELNMTFGGYESTGEPAGFGDPVILEEFSRDAEVRVDDPIAEDPEVLEMLDMPETDIYVLRVTWGHLEQEGTASLDWTGSASLVNGAILVRKTILFDAGDYIERPREDRRVVDWVSKTYTHLDGLCLILIDPVSLLTEEGVVNQFTFETGPYTGTFEMAELAAIDTLIAVDDEGNAVHFEGFKREPGACMAGFTRGQWYRRGLDWGEFRGGWIGSDGELAGHVQGIWGYDADGRNVLYGKYIDTDGNFLGLLKGTFAAAPSREVVRGRHGWMHGQWYDEDENPVGVFRGRWKEPRRRGEHGYFQAVWGAECPELEAEISE